MGARFNFSIEDLTDDSPDAILREIHKDQPDSNQPLKTTASEQGDPGRLSVLSMAQIMQGYPLYNSSEEVLNTQELVFTHLLTGAVTQKGADSYVPLNVPGFQSELLIPADIAANAELFREKFGPKPGDATAAGGGTGGGTNYGATPADVAASEAFKHTDTNGPHVEKLIQLMISQSGDAYNNTGSQVRGITLDPNPTSFDCSGLVWWASNQLIQPDPWGSSGNGDYQIDFCRDHGCELTVDQGLRTPGALIVWYGQHTAVSLGNGTHIASTGGIGVGIGDNSWNTWDRAALIPFFNYAGVPTSSTGTVGTAGAGGAVSGSSSGTFSGQGGDKNAKLLWAQTFLKGLGAPDGTNNLVSVIAWELGENTDAKYNPLATTEKWPGSTNFNNNAGYPVQNYATPDDGFNATIKTITNGYYSNVLNDLKAGAAPEQTMGHFNGGPSGGSDLNTWGTGENGYKCIADARTVVNNFFAFLSGR